MCISRCCLSVCRCLCLCVSLCVRVRISTDMWLHWVSCPRHTDMCISLRCRYFFPIAAPDLRIDGLWTCYEERGCYRNITVALPCLSARHGLQRRRSPKGLAICRRGFHQGCLDHLQRLLQPGQGGGKGKVTESMSLLEDMLAANMSLQAKSSALPPRSFRPRR